MHIYKVRYNQTVKYSNGDEEDFCSTESNVMAANAEEAISAVKEHEIGRREDFEHDDGSVVFQETTSIEITGVEEIISVDYQDE